MKCDCPFEYLFPKHQFQFHGSTKKTLVDGFAVMKEKMDRNVNADDLAKQVRVLFFEHTRQFGVELLGKHGARVGLARFEHRPENSGSGVSVAFAKIKSRELCRWR